jgi:hypothetical protein
MLSFEARTVLTVLTSIVKPYNPRHIVSTPTMRVNCLDAEMSQMASCLEMSKARMALASLCRYCWAGKKLVGSGPQRDFVLRLAEERRGSTYSLDSSMNGVWFR